MENGSDDSPSFSCQSLFPNGLESHGSEGSRLDLRRVGTAKPPPSPSLPTATSVRTPIALRPKPPSTTSYSEKNETPSPRQKTKARENLESTFQSRCSGVHRSDGSGAHGTIKGGAVDRSSSCDPSRATHNTVVYDLTASDVTGTTSGNVDGVAASEENMADSGDTAVMAMLAEFTEMARRTAAQNEELKKELVEERRRLAHTNRKLDQCKSTCADLRESLTLAQDTVVRMREHEMKWAESTANEMSLRVEVCALKDERATALGDAAALKKRCEALRRENNELGERFAAVAEEKRHVESRARRLLRSDRYRGF